MPGFPEIGYGGGGGGVWTQTGELIEAVDMTASLIAAGAIAPGAGHLRNFAVNVGSQADAGPGASVGAAAFGGSSPMLTARSRRRAASQTASRASARAGARTANFRQRSQAARRSASRHVLWLKA